MTQELGQQAIVIDADDLLKNPGTHMTSRKMSLSCYETVMGGSEQELTVGSHSLPSCGLA